MLQMNNQNRFNWTWRHQKQQKDSSILGFPAQIKLLCIPRQDVYGTQKRFKRPLLHTHTHSHTYSQVWCTRTGGQRQRLITKTEYVFQEKRKIKDLQHGTKVLTLVLGIWCYSWDSSVINKPSEATLTYTAP